MTQYRRAHFQFVGCGRLLTAPFLSGNIIILCPNIADPYFKAGHSFSPLLPATGSLFWYHLRRAPSSIWLWTRLICVSHLSSMRFVCSLVISIVSGLCPKAIRITQYAGEKSRSDLQRLISIKLGQENSPTHPG